MRRYISGAQKMARGGESVIVKIVEVMNLILPTHRKKSPNSWLNTIKTKELE